MESIESPLYIEALPGESISEFAGIVRKLIRAAGHGNPDGVSFTLGEAREIEDGRYVEFRCLAGSVWIMLLMAARKRKLQRRLVHTISDSDGERLEIIGNEK